MSFGRWLPLDGAAAPDGPGCLQVRVGEGPSGLHDYPRGKSAMVYYGADDARLAVALDRFRAALAPADRARLFVRFDPRPDGTARLGKLLDEFRGRFGAPPLRNDQS